MQDMNRGSIIKCKQMKFPEDLSFIPSIVILAATMSIWTSPSPL